MIFTIRSAMLLHETTVPLNGTSSHGPHITSERMNLPGGHQSLTVRPGNRAAGMSAMNIARGNLPFLTMPEGVSTV